MRLASVVALLFLGCDLSVAPPPPPPDPNTIHLGFLAPFSGPSAFIGLGAEKSARLALKEINEAGGVNGKKLDLILRDTRTGLPESPSISVAAVNELADAGVVAIIGPDASANVVAVKDTVVARGVPLIATGATSPAITGLADNDLIWRTPPSDAVQGLVLANLIRRDGMDGLAIIHRDDPYGNGLASVLRTSFEQTGGQVLAYVSYPVGKFEGFEPEVEQLLASGSPPAIAIVGFGQDTAGILRALQVRNPVPRPALYGGDANSGQLLIDNTPPEILVGMRSTAPSFRLDSPNYVKFAESYRRTVGEEPEYEFVYDAVYLAALAMVQGRENSAAAVRAHLRDVSRPDSATPLMVGVGADEFMRAAQNAGADLDFQGASGDIDFDMAGDVTHATYVVREMVATPEGLQSMVLERVSFP
ncbi:ABC transporter substrate-binding protein [Archangium lansingense]|uniref:ABC transporter substrate-binding protein n=1 Tax=Archangium lansingense TaxID=2995310 RepID=UPI003B804987